MGCYVHFWENAVGLTQSLAYDDLRTASEQQAMWGGTVRPYPFSATEYNRRSDPPRTPGADDYRRKARELAEMAGRHPTGEVARAIEQALIEAAGKEAQALAIQVPAAGKVGF